MTLTTVTVTDADTYFATTPRDATWQAVTDKQIWLNEAQQWLGQLCFDPSATCCGNDFAASWTRAVSELALAMQQNPTALITGAASGGLGPVKRQKLDALEVEYFDPRSATTEAGGVSPKAPLVLRTFPWLKDILGCWLTSTGSTSLMLRVRS